MKPRLKIAPLVLMLFLTGATANSQGPPGGPPGPPEGPMREKVRERIKTIKVWKLTEDLNLSQSQSEKFFPIYNRFFDKWEEIEQQKREIIRRLDELTLKEKTDDSEIGRQLDRLDSLDQEVRVLKVKLRGDLKDVLSERQIGRLYVFELRFLQQMQEIMRDVRRESRGPRFGREPED